MTFPGMERVNVLLRLETDENDSVQRSWLIVALRVGKFKVIRR